MILLYLSLVNERDIAPLIVPIERAIAPTRKGSIMKILFMLKSIQVMIDGIL